MSIHRYPSRFLPVRSAVLAVSLIVSGCTSQGADSVQTSQPVRRLSPAASATATRKSAEPPVSNRVLIYSEAPGNRPFTVSRVFAAGEIPQSAQVVFNGSAVPTQCDVKTRYPDGSVQHAIVSFWGQAGSSANEVVFVNIDPPTTGEPLTAEAMLSADFDFKAIMELSSAGESRRVDAREMLSSGAFRYWLKGPICTQVVIEDRSPARSFDLGWNERKPFHPMFVATFYPGLRGVKVEWIGETAWTNESEDLSYSLVLKTSRPDGEAIVYQRDDFTHFRATRWRKTFWSGAEPPLFLVDFNLAYMIYSRLLPSYDLGKVVSEAAVQKAYNAFLKSDRGEPGGRALWNMYFPSTGGRDDIGLFPSWYVGYLYTWDSRFKEIMDGSAAASGSMPIHYRESTSRPYLLGSSIDAFGRPISIEARRTLWIARLDYNQTSPGDRILLTGAKGKTGWEIDLAHQPSIVFLPYIFSGDYYLLEELQFWGAYNSAACSPGDCGGYCRNWYSSFINEQTRSKAWGLRTIAHASFATPDGEPEKTYLTDKVYSNLAALEGIADVRDGAFFDDSPNSVWSFGRTKVAMGLKNPLHFIDANQDHGTVATDRFNVDPTSPDRVTRVNAPWQYNFVHIVMGHIEELGFPAGPLRRALATHLLNQLANPVCNHFLVADYMTPVFNGSNSFIDNWQGFANAWNAERSALQRWPERDDGDVVHGYPHIARAAASFLPGLCDGPVCGDEAWAWITRNVGFQERLNDDPKWALVPRTVQRSEALQDYARRRQSRFQPKFTSSARSRKP